MTKLNTWLENSKPLIPVIVIDNIDHAVPMAKALVAGGVHLLEVTLRTEAGLAAIQQISEQVPEAIVGAGTVCNANEYQQAIDAGAQFIVSPGLTTELITKAQQVEKQGEWHLIDGEIFEDKKGYVIKVDNKGHVIKVIRSLNL